MASRYSASSLLQACQLRPLRSLIEAAARCSASLPRICRCPSSVFGTRTPSRKSADPMPVPSVSISTVPTSPRPAPKRISARPAASASLPTISERPSASAKSVSAGVPIQDGSMLAAVLTTPSMITAGKPMPACSARGSSATSPAVALITAFGVAGWGVGTRTRSVMSSPLVVSTTAALMPVPPTSMPINSMPASALARLPRARARSHGTLRPPSAGRFCCDTEAPRQAAPHSSHTTAEETRSCSSE